MSPPIVEQCPKCGSTARVPSGKNRGTKCHPCMLASKRRQYARRREAKKRQAKNARAREAEQRAAWFDALGTTPQTVEQARGGRGAGKPRDWATPIEAFSRRATPHVPLVPEVLVPQRPTAPPPWRGTPEEATRLASMGVWVDA